MSLKADCLDFRPWVKAEFSVGLDAGAPGVRRINGANRAISPIIRCFQSSLRSILAVEAVLADTGSRYPDKR